KVQVNSAVRIEAYQRREPAADQQPAVDLQRQGKVTRNQAKIGDRPTELHVHAAVRAKPHKVYTLLPVDGSKITGQPDLAVGLQYQPLRHVEKVHLRSHGHRRKKVRIQAAI